MAINVVCPGCRKSFQVSDKFAGKSGPCPNCKRPLKVPAKSEEVQVHAPEAFASGGKTISGKLITKPVAFKPSKVQPVMIAAIAGSVLFVLILTWLCGGLFQKSLIATTLGLIIVSPALVIGAYSVLHNDELEPYRGKELYLRTSLCALGYVFLWGMFALLISRGVITGEIWSWLLVAPPFVMVGGLFAMAALDLDFGDALFCYGFYLVSTLILRWAAGMKWVWDLTEELPLQ